MIEVFIYVVVVRDFINSLDILVNITTLCKFNSIHENRIHYKKRYKLLTLSHTFSEKERFRLYIPLIFVDRQRITILIVEIYLHFRQKMS